MLDYMYIEEDMVTFTALAKKIFRELFLHTKVAGLGKIFIQQKFSYIHVQ